MKNIQLYRLIDRATQRVEEKLRERKRIKNDRKGLKGGVMKNILSGVDSMLNITEEEYLRSLIL